MLANAQAVLVVVEATGRYERAAVWAMQPTGLSAARVNPRQARDFAKAMGVLARTDQVDARTWRDFADVLARHEERSKYITPMLEQAREHLAELMTCRRQQDDMRLAEHNRLEHASAVTARSKYDCHEIPLSAESMRSRTSHRGTSMPVAATRPGRDGEVPFIR